MSSLEATFTLTPRSPVYSDDSLNNRAWLGCCGADFAYYRPSDLSSLYASNSFFFYAYSAADPDLDYTQWANRKKARYVESYINLQSYAASHKQLALIVGFDVPYSGRVLVTPTRACSKTSRSSMATITFSSKSSPWIYRCGFTSSTPVATGFSRDSAATWSDTKEGSCLTYAVVGGGMPTQTQSATRSIAAGGR